MLSKRFPEKRAFITGAASGLGLAFSKRLAKEGWRLMIADINVERLGEAEISLQAMGGTIIAQVLNVADEQEILVAAARIEREWGGVDMVFNNAGVAGSGPFEELGLEQWHRMLDIDLWSVIYGCRAFVPMMKRHGGGYLINTASSAGTLAAPQMASYNVAKAGVVSISETLKVELAPFNIGVTVVCPTVFKTNLGESLKGGTSFDHNLQRQLDVSTFTCENVVDATFKVINKNRTYVMPQKDAIWMWRFKRLAPEFYLRLVSYLYSRRKWAFSYLE